MKKNLINEDISKMMNLIGYDRGKTLTENQQNNGPKQLNEQGVLMIPQLLAAAGIGYLASKTVTPAVKAVGKVIMDGLSSFGTQIASLLGVSIGSPEAMVILNSGTWSSLDATFKELEEKFQVEQGFIKSKIVSEGNSWARSSANQLYQAMDGLGTDEDAIEMVYDDAPTLYDCAHISAAYGNKEGENLIEWLDDDGVLDDVSGYLRNKPYMNFNGTEYEDLQSLTVAITTLLKEQSAADELKQQEEDAVANKTELKNKFKNFPCVVVEIDNATEVVHPYKEKDNQVKITLENGDIMVVNTVGKYIAKVGGEQTSGQIECPDDFTLEDEEELTLSEGYYIFEQNFGGIKLKPKGSDTEKEDGGGSSSDSGGGSSSRRTDLDYMDVVGCNGEVKKGDRGQVVKDVQSKLNESPKVDPKLKVDGIFGSKTEAAIKQAGGTGVFNCELAKALDAETNTPEDGVAGEETEQEEEKAIELEISQIKTKEEAKEALEDTKEEIKDLKQQRKDIRKQKRGLKKIKRLCKKHPDLEQCKDTQSLQEWYRR